MIYPPGYIKTFEEKIKQKRSIRQQKILKSKLKTLLPTQTTIKMYFAQKNPSNKKSIDQNEIYRLYVFDSIPKSQYEKILSNPIYYLQNQRNIRMFKMFLRKNGYFDQLQRSNTKAISEQLKNNITSLGQEKNAFEYQFTDKSKINYKEPWKYMKDTINSMSQRQLPKKRSRAKSMFLKPQNVNLLRPVQQQKQRKKSQIISTSRLLLPTDPINITTNLLTTQFSKQTFKLPLKLQVSTNLLPQPKSFKQNIKKRHQNIQNLKFSLWKQFNQREQSKRIEYFSKLTELQLRMKKKQQVIEECSKMKLDKMDKRDSQYREKRNRAAEMYSSLADLNESIRQTCKNTLNSIRLQNNNPLHNIFGKSCISLINKSVQKPSKNPALNPSKTHPKLPRTKSAQQSLKRKKQRNQKLLHLLQQRLGINQKQDNPTINPQKDQ